MDIEEDISINQSMGIARSRGLKKIDYFKAGRYKFATTHGYDLGMIFMPDNRTRLPQAASEVNS